MRSLFRILFFLFLCLSDLFAQSAQEIVAAVLKSQHSLRTISYELTRKDTLVNDVVRTMRGSVMIMVDTTDTIFGFNFRSKDDALASETVYDGHVAYETKDETKVYTLITKPADIGNLLFRSGGRILMQDLIKLDTAGANGFVLHQNELQFFLKITYPDLNKYDVTNRFKLVTIDRKMMLPVSVKQHQETLGKVQDLYYQITNIAINEPTFDYNFAEPAFLKDFTQHIEVLKATHPILYLKGKPAPSISLQSFNGEKILLKDFKGKVTLLDFWEVWCGPCIESMPKIQVLYDRYKEKGLEVYGIVNDLKQLESSKKFISKRLDIKFPMLVGNDQLKKNYFLEAVPMYILIGKTGQVKFISLGYSNDLEDAILLELSAP